MPQSPMEQKNADRFTGFAAAYDQARPAMPFYPVKIITGYLGRQPGTVVDLGSGTGLSAMVWKKNCTQVIGIEPSEDMLRIAKQKECEGVTFRQGFGNNTGLPDGCADAVICSQSFHWMEPFSTLKEVNRLLGPGGVFATVDCDWPPVAPWQAEQAYSRLYETVKQLEGELNDVKNTFVRFDKKNHLANLQKSGYFGYCREILFAHTEPCTAGRLVNLMLSQGSLQTILRRHPGLLQEQLARFQRIINSAVPKGSFPIDFCYRMRVGVK